MVLGGRFDSLYYNPGTADNVRVAATLWHELTPASRDAGYWAAAAPSEITVAVHRHFPPEEWDTAFCVAFRASTWQPTAVGLAGEISIWQIHPVHFGRFDTERLWKIDYNTWAASVLWQERGWQPWVAERAQC